MSFNIKQQQKLLSRVRSCAGLKFRYTTPNTERRLFKQYQSRRLILGSAALIYTKRMPIGVKLGEV